MSGDSAPEHERRPELVPGEPRSFGSGRYVVERRLGAGNFATVYLAFDERLDVPVAVKLLSDRWSWEPEVRGRFVQEARLLRSLNDPHVVQIRDIAETEDGRPYLVMDYASRGTLEQRLIELAQRQLRPDASELRRVAAAVADALAVLHERRIAHRDIKPSNLLLTADDRRITGGRPSIDIDSIDSRVIRDGERIMLGDLGLAKDLAFDSGITAGVGTAGYMAPEQTLPGAKIDTRTDIYAVSALMAQVASGEAPDPLRRYSDGRIESGRPLPPSVPEPLASVLRRGLDSDPDRRIATIEQWRREVDEALSSGEGDDLIATPREPIAAEMLRVGHVTPPNIGARSTRLRATAAAGALAVVVLVIAVLINSRGSGSAAPTTTASDTSASSTTPTTAVAATSAVTLSTVIASTTPTAPITAPITVPTTGPTPTVPPTAASTVPPATVPATTVPATTVPATTAAPTLAVSLVGPTAIQRGVEAAWTVDSPLAVSGTWSLTGPVQINPGQDGWLPGNYFRGTWNVASTNTLTLTVVDAAGNTASDSITFTVT